MVACIIMDPGTAFDLGKEAILLLLKISTPIMLTALVVGLFISLIQALTQVQEQTLTFVPKIIAIFIAFIFAFPFIGRELATFTEKISTLIISGG